MSSKTQRRRERRERRSQEGPKGNPAKWFTILIAAAILVIGAVAMTRGTGQEPPRPGMVWSEEHQHWH